MFALATLVSGAALAKGGASTAPPKNLRGFLLSPSEPVSHTFSRTPAFAWAPTRGALCYEFELATSRKFGENAIVWSNVRYGVKPGGGCAAVSSSGTDAGADSAPRARRRARAVARRERVARLRVRAVRRHGHARDGRHGYDDRRCRDPNVDATIQPLRVPAVSVDVALPWFTGQPYALYAHVRAITMKGPTGWSTPFAFNMRWAERPDPAPDAARSRAVGQRQRCDRLPGLVPGRPEGLLDAHECCRPA